MPYPQKGKLDDVHLFEEEFDLWLQSIVAKDWERAARTAESKREEIGQLGIYPDVVYEDIGALADAFEKLTV